MSMHESGIGSEHAALGAKILVIGNARSALLNLDSSPDGILDLVANPLEGIHAVSMYDYQGMAVVTQGLLYRLRPIIDALRETYAGRIVLLCQMVEEPLVRHLIRAARDNQVTQVKDDYLICPTRAASLTSLFEADSEQAESGSPGPWRDGAYDRRIRLLEQLATEDDLTGLKNRRYIWEFGKQILDYAEGETARVTLLVYDIDDFKHYNDVYGHPAGDKILKEAAILMRRCCRAHDVVGRIGGDVFVVIFWDDPQVNKPRTETERRSAQMEHPKEALLVAKRFQAELEKSELSFLGPSGRGVLTISGGLASYPRDGQTIERLFQKADDALLEAKRSGKNRIYLVGAPQRDMTEAEAQADESVHP
jgi:diguanylate cyclase (GGDEF)-like protein